MLKGLNLSVVTFIFLAATLAHAEDEATAERRKQIRSEYRAAQDEVLSLVPDLTFKPDAAKREQAAPNALPLLRRMRALATELEAASAAERPRAVGMRIDAETKLCLFGDTETIEALQHEAESPEPVRAYNARIALLGYRWVVAYEDEAKQVALLAEAEDLAKQHPDNIPLCQLIVRMCTHASPAPAIKARAEYIILNILNEPNAQSMVTASRKRDALIGNPVVVAGPLLDGTHFTSEAWLGRVVVVDVWANAKYGRFEEMSKMLRVYNEYHDQGLEVVALPFDSREGIESFLEAHREFTWPVLFDQNRPGIIWAEEEFGIDSYPLVLVIDKKGNARHYGFAGFLKELVPKLLAE